jgi:GNAT superfamily N-acetyltransferase/protein tyrosine phosphatase (PTP) superfamily phosphohydrolase (DUF442 family)
MAPVVVTIIDPRRPAMAARIHAVQVAAYRQEAALLGVERFPPLERTPADIAASADVHFGAWDGASLLGVISLEPRSSGEALISSLTVEPSAQRRGVGRALVAVAAARADYVRLAVSTGARNLPALALYRQLGFEERRRGSVGPEGIEVIELAAPSATILSNTDAHRSSPAPERANEALASIYNYRELGPRLAASGQPDEPGLAAIAAAGYELVLNLALHDDPRYSLPDEPGTVRGLGMRYVHIPVRFDAPTREDLLRFFEAMEANRECRTWVHCAANMRVSVFLGLYWHLREGRPLEQAFALQRDIWEPDPVWQAFIARALADGEA